MHTRIDIHIIYNCSCIQLTHTHNTKQINHALHKTLLYTDSAHGTFHYSFRPRAR